MARTPKPKAGQILTVPNNPGICKRGMADGSVVYYAHPYDPDLKKKVKLPNRATLEEAKADKRRFEQEKSERRTATGVETVRDWSQRWMILHGNRRGESTQRHYMERIRAFVTDFGDRPLASIGRAELDLWVRGGPAGPDLADVARSWAGVEEKDGMIVVPSHRTNGPPVRAMFNDARRSGLIEFNPAADMGIEKSRGREDIQVPDFHGSDLDDLVRIAGEVHRGPWGRYVFGPMILIAAWTGLRPGELFALTPADVELDAVDEMGRPDPKLHVRRQYNSKLKKTAPTKNKQRREVALLRTAQEVFRKLELDTLPQDEVIFKTAKGKPFSQAHLNFYWTPVRLAFAATRPANHWLSERHRDGAKEGLDFYELRHWFASRLAEMGVSPYDIAEQMGHQDGGKLAMKVYIHPRNASGRRRIHALEDAADEAA